MESGDLTVWWIGEGRRVEDRIEAHLPVVARASAD